MQNRSHSNRPFRHLGQYRSLVQVDGTSRPITWDEAAIDVRVLKAIFRHGPRFGLTHGDLLQRARSSAAELRASVDRLLDWKFLELATGRAVDSPMIRLTDAGEVAALDFVAEDDRQKAIADQEHVRAQGRAQVSKE